MNKELIKSLITLLELEHDRVRSLRDDQQEESNRHVGRMASRYDTFKEEAHMMVAAHEARMIEIADGITKCKDLINSNDSRDRDQLLGSTVSIIKEDRVKRYLIAPYGGGMKVTSSNDVEYVVITTGTPLYRAIKERELIGIIAINSDD